MAVWESIELRTAAPSISPDSEGENGNSIPPRPQFLGPGERANLEEKTTRSERDKESMMRAQKLREEREMMELAALYPTGQGFVEHTSPSQENQRGESEEPCFLVYIGRSKLEVTWHGSNAAIDFGLPGLRITKAEFVGLKAFSQQRPSSKSAPPVPAALGQNLFKAFKRRGQQESSSSIPRQSQSGVTLEELQQLARGSQGNQKRNLLQQQQQVYREQSPASGNQLDELKGSINVSGRTPSSAATASQNQGSSRLQQEGIMQRESEKTKFRAMATNGKRRSSWGGPGTSSNAGLDVWEVVWKDSQSQGPIRRLKFETNTAGYELVCSVIDFWAEAAHDSSIMEDAARAALQACGGSIKENSWAAIPRFPEAARPGHEKRQAANGPYNEMAELSRSVSEIERRLSTLVSPRNGLSSPADPAQLRAGEKEKHRFVGLAQGHLSQQQDVFKVYSTGVSPAEAAKVAAELAGRPDGPEVPGNMAENVISWGSVMVEGKYLPRREGQSLVLKDGHFKALAAALPARMRTLSWILHYSTQRDGISLNTLFRKVSKKGPLLLVIRDSAQHVFGCFTSEEWRPWPRYYGNGECFVFQVQPQLKAYRWTRSNSYFMFSSSTFLAIGGGGQYSLLLNSDLLSGASGECETFGSSPLASSAEFDVIHVEVWGFR